MTTGIENIFLAYANLLPKEMPGSLKKVYEVARDYFEIHQSTHDEMLKLFDLLKYFDENPDITITSIDANIRETAHYRAFWAVYRSEKRCISCREPGLPQLNEWAQLDIKRQPKINKKRPKCYDCSQFQFVDLLTRKFVNKERGIVDQVMLGIFNNGYKSIIKQMRYTEQSGEKRKLNSYMQWEIRREGDVVIIPNSINGIILDLSGVSLCEFLQKNDSRKIKKCHNCDIFFVAEKADDRIKFCSSCSPKRKWSKEKSAKYMREIYRPRKKQQKLTKEREARINRMMQAGWSREEAEEVIKADSKV